ncbi:CofG protein [Leptolyngbya boryana NIES-2135]|jgi:FO synthase subunit 1|uniref:7,8-didemethyl-8-hydroxy-5-deazariboflavin synthase n=1 Tax=Leptolyngbya boryana NIES-2135 TaxID=1973484 RepID=A0A1Z4JIR7_LEPBY|nr:MULTISPECIES: 7,8-didemethyl-8-hydroxy-5-deazariboflavin synthase subunit CofG [Leptolyngbya]BAY56447.1 CofG protein [Leptolyngbya boryana NIES-2135]MBD2371225.1 7,8-didemethyl-8-hydroxy-5-deazariboflavin synthase subunit CofG [Leptolyngbya sp. FACHB-161]MBD2377628.1 7,8-didemethyl-8-hydroxy-5-deazariboflavin synthase subunit CofG [Leptolyngbya sp. FACHB-238]MBD2402080.1 7,8-didemethyl-8-hydroxy-5-deazariboflavin synthase subunit CofG [Leptolyngbya sp. FACHB-239]MBD2408600.1 7,8-didemethyl-
MKAITYSSAYTIVPTYECFNRCTYCNFRTDPGQDEWMSLAQAEHILQRLDHVVELLILSGEVHPNSARRASWFDRIFDLCKLALSMGFLPHTNAGILSFDEMAKLKTVNVSMGLMLEQMTPTLLESVHRHAPSKLPEVRLQQLAWAGELQIPFTTGLLLGIGESERDRIETLVAIANIHEQYKHIQEVILQPYSPGQKESLSQAAFQPRQLIQLIKIARSILPDTISIQIPPNLVAEDLIACLDAGAQDLGGISPHDEVNPDYPHPKVEALRQQLEPQSYHLVQRLPIYPQYDRWLADDLRAAVEHHRTAGLETSKNSVTYRK